jgi:hypothetical protein
MKLARVEHRSTKMPAGRVDVTDPNGSYQDDLHRELIARVRQSAGDVRRFTAGIDDRGLQTRTVPDAWSLIELIIHLQRVHQLFESRIDSMLMSECPAFNAYAPENDAQFAEIVAGRPGRAAVDAHLAESERFAKRLETLTLTDWARTGQHPAFGLFDIEFLVDYMTQHEAHHVYQLFMRRVPLVHRPRGEP